MKHASDKSKMSGEITPVKPPKNVIARRTKPLEVPRKVEELPTEPITFTLWERVTLAVDETIFKTKLVISLTPFFVTLIRGLVMKDLKTTITGALGALAMLLSAFGVVTLSAEIQAAIVAVTVFFIGLFSSDAKKTA